MISRLSLVLVVVAAVALIGCGGKTVNRVETDEQIDLSGNWNDIDSQNVAGDLVDQITDAAWVENHIEQHGTKPAIIVGSIRNKTVDHIPMKTLTADLERAFINSGRVVVVASPDEREQIHDEREALPAAHQPEHLGQEQQRQQAEDQEQKNCQE